MISTQEIVVRLLAALLFSGVVGLQRALTGKAAGMRTHIMVGVGAALFTLLSSYAFPTAATNADRIASQVVTGIGFIGGGAILKERGSIKGLTTAAGLWAAAALGMAAGAGLYVMAIITTAIILLTLVALRRIEVHFPRRASEAWTIWITLASDTAVDAVREIVAARCRRAVLVALEAENEQTRLAFAVEIPHHFAIAALTTQLRAAGAGSVVWRAAGVIELEDGP